MNRIIMFSPVGGTDPIAISNCRDGSMLHIARHYKPSKIILYMSWEVLQNHKADNRYLYCLDHLGELQNRSMEYEIIERPELKNVQEYDYFYQEFRDIIMGIFREMDDSDELILNVSSGTPAMKSALMVLYTLGEFPCKAVQVITPDKKMNEHTHKGYDVETLWELDEDNCSDYENRCHEVQCPSLSVIKSEEIIKKHISVYDYRAAATVAQEIPDNRRCKYYDLLRMASYRVLLNFFEVDRILKKETMECIPVRSGGDRKCFEYALLLEIKLSRGEYTDFIRGLTPLIVDLFEMILKRRFQINVDQFCSVNNSSNLRRWDMNKLKNTEILSLLNTFYRPFKGNDISSDHLRILIEHYADDNRLKGIVNDIRKVERQVRNPAAHEIVAITDDTIKEITGFSGQQIMNKIKVLFEYTGMGIKKEYWDSYDKMNQIILKEME